MELISFEFNKKYDIGNLVIALGQFDGLHLAHLKIIKNVIEIAKTNNLKSAIITFYPHPDYVLGKRTDKGYLTTQENKKHILEELGLDYFIVIPFDKDMATLHYLNFEKEVLESFNIKEIVVGYDYKYGHKGQGNVNTLKEKYKVNIVEEVLYENQKMGSTLVRNYLATGELEKVTEILGRFYNVTATVSKGSQFGRTLGIRTANIEIGEDYLELKHGVYGVLVTIDGIKYGGVCNVGHNPSFNYVEKPRIEVHVLDFNEILYDREISVDFIFYLRNELYFEDKDELIKQINQDINYCKPIIEKYLRG